MNGIPGAAACLACLLALSSGQAALSDPFDTDQVFQFKIEVPEAGMATLRRSTFHRRMPSLSHRPKTSAKVHINGIAFNEVAIHLKGAAGSFRSVDDKPAFTIHLDKHIREQDFKGYDKFYLNNSVQDPTYFNEILCRELFAQAGIPVPRAVHATVELNGRDLGLYVMLEGFNKRFLRRHFKNVDGNLYDGGFLNDLTKDLKVNNGADPLNHDAKDALTTALFETDMNQLLPGIVKWLDMDLFLTHLALDTLTWNWDGYAMNRNNYRLYHNRDTGKFQFIPHGMDQMFKHPYGDIYPRHKGLAAQSVMQLPQIRQQYFQRMRKLFGTVFQPEHLIHRIEQLTAVVDPELKKRNMYAGSRHQRAVLRLKENIQERSDFLAFQLSAPDRALKFPASGVIALKKWKASRLFGDIQLRESSVQGRSVLMLESGRELSIGRWYSRQLLTRGIYRLVGSVRCDGVVPRPG